MLLTKKNRKLFENLLRRLPQTYPKPELVVYSSQKDLEDDFWCGDAKEFHIYAYCDPHDLSIHISSSTLNNEKVEDLLFILLHEIGHLYCHKKYGIYHELWQDSALSEKYANKFASRWSKKLAKEGFLL